MKACESNSKEPYLRCTIIPCNSLALPDNTANTVHSVQAHAESQSPRIIKPIGESGLFTLYGKVTICQILVSILITTLGIGFCNAGFNHRSFYQTFLGTFAVAAISLLIVLFILQIARNHIAQQAAPHETNDAEVDPYMQTK